MIFSFIRKKNKFAFLSFLMLSTLSNAAYAEEQEGKETPTDFVRDVMMPIGLPVVSTYHAVRESIFLNTTVENESPIEALGNLLLAPSQYLFGGKKIILNEAKCDVVQVFDYKEHYWIKALASVIALPISDLLGATIKGIAYLSPEVRERQKKIEKALRAPVIHSHIEDYQRKGLPPFYSEEFIECKEHKRPSYLTKKQKIEIQALKETIELLEKNEIIYWIDCGTCLGAYRYGGIIPWDWDIDISILVDDHENVKKILSTLDPEKYQIQDWSSYDKPKTFLKLYVKETKNFIDIYHYRINEEDRTVGYDYTNIDSPFPESWKQAELKCIKPLKYEEMFPLKYAKFDSLTVRAPHDVIAFLQSKYGENLDPTMVWDEPSQTYLKVEDHPYYQ